MQHEGILLDALACTRVLDVCNNKRAKRFFVYMSTRYGVNPSLDCYSCMVDLFGHARDLHRATVYMMICVKMDA